MLTFFSVKNFRQFREELVFDFSKVRDYQFNLNCVKNGYLNKAIIYGKNAVGKTNLMEAMRDICSTMRGRYMVNDISYRNADAGKDETILFRYSFLLDDTVIDYQYEKTDYNHVVAEKLVFDNNVIFEYNRIKNFYNFENAGKIGADQLQWDAFRNMNNSEDDVEIIDILTALRFAYSNTATSQHTPLGKLVRFIAGMQFSVGFSAINRANVLKILLDEFANSNENNVKEFQDFLNEYGVNCKLIALPEVDGKKKLFFDYKTPLDFFVNMSSGTRLLTLFYLQFIKNRFKFSFVFIDEFDAYYHYELSEKIVRLLEERYDFQVVLTTHNTNLLSNTIMRPDCFLILHDGRITPICDATPRELRQGHNLEKLYMNGEFDAD